MPKLPALIEQIIEKAGPPLSISELTFSGDILHSITGEKFFSKVQNDVEQMRGEIEGLRAMALTSVDLVPKVLGFEVSTSEREAGMVTQYFHLTSVRGSENQRELARKLAKMHNPPSGGVGTDGFLGKFGFSVPTHCGVTKHDNTWEDEWEVFFRDRRLGDIVRRIGDGQVTKTWEEMKQRAVPLLLRDFKPAPKPVILHGDLWSGNAGYDSTSKTPVIFDPASYYGHNEADLGITHMFGGFSKVFYEEYHKIHPRTEPYYDQRQKLYELYHHLNHTLMFGGGYRSGALGIMRSLIQWAEEVDADVAE